MNPPEDITVDDLLEIEDIGINIIERIEWRKKHHDAVMNKDPTYQNNDCHVMTALCLGSTGDCCGRKCRHRSTISDFST